MEREQTTIRLSKELNEKLQKQADMGENLVEIIQFNDHTCIVFNQTISVYNAEKFTITLDDNGVGVELFSIKKPL